MNNSAGRSLLSQRDREADSAAVIASFSDVDYPAAIAQHLDDFANTSSAGYIIAFYTANDEQ